jgi:signal transduction histidine kinase/CheY-like chemotaxis protein
MNFPINAETYNTLNNLFIFFGTLDSQGFVINLGGKILEKFKINPQLLHGQKFSEMTFWKDSEQNLKKLAQTFNNSSTNGSKIYLDFRVAERENIFIQLHLQPVNDENSSLNHIFFYAHEITEEDKKALSEKSPAVDDGLNEKARQEVEKVKRDKDFFLAFLSHELRSPLNTILGWAKILLTKEINETVRKNALETIERSARLQSKLIDNLVDSARISSGKLRLELVELNFFEVLKNIYETQKPLAEAKNVSLEFTYDKENITVLGDSMRLQQMFTILVSAALKSTASGGHINIAAQTEENEATVIIQDDGQGINPESLPGIFEQFQQSGEKKPFSAIALGMELSIVKILAEKHNGSVQAASPGIGYGSTFTVRLPLANSESKIESDIEISTPERIRRLDEINILVVEDDPDSREVLQLFLEQSGAKVKSAESVFDAMSLINEAAKNLPDMIISDLAMPNEDGYALLSQIRKLPPEKGGSIPAIALSAFATYSNKQQAYQSGFQKYHTKPFEPDKLISDILMLVKK